MLVKKGYCYILANKNKTVLYVGAIDNLQRRIREHKEGKYLKSFTKRYSCKLLVYFEEFDEIKDAFERERKLKAGNRKRKEYLINLINPKWKDVSENWFDGEMDSE
ncbi:MAG: GIY-YIG nuclease family protein [Bacteroidota bacterium]